MLGVFASQFESQITSVATQLTQDHQACITSTTVSGWNLVNVVGQWNM